MSKEFILPVITTGAVTSGFFGWALVYLFVLKPDKGQIVAGWIAKILARANANAQKTATAISIQRSVERFISDINGEVNDLLPYGLKIKWVDPSTTPDAFTKDNRVIVHLSHHRNLDENLSRSTMMYMNKAVVPKARPHIDKKLGKSIDLMMTKKALYSFYEARSAMGHFVDTVLEPEIESDSNIRGYCRAIEVVDERGMFTRVLLRELQELGLRRAGSTESGDSVNESTQFVKTLKDIANKERGEDVDLSFIGKDIKSVIILVARPEKLRQGAGRYVVVIKNMLGKGVRVVYIFCRGKENIVLAKQVKDGCKNINTLKLIHEESYLSKYKDGATADTYCAVFYNEGAP